jgi:hypothetical protein
MRFSILGEDEGIDLASPLGGGGAVDPMPVPVGARIPTERPTRKETDNSARLERTIYSSETTTTTTTSI